MLKFGNKEFRNLQEQVFKNMKDIQDIMDGTTVLAEFGIRVVGHVNSITELPDPSTYTGEFGDAYVVGASEPYDYYIYTRAFEGDETPQWFYLGKFPVPGPQGPQGESAGFGVVSASAEVGSVASASVTVSGQDTAKDMHFDFTIPGVDASSYVTISTDQTITGVKTFYEPPILGTKTGTVDLQIGSTPNQIHLDTHAGNNPRIRWSDTTTSNEVTALLPNKSGMLLTNTSLSDNLKTINGQTIIGKGNIEITAGASEWGQITGTLSNQTDLQSALDAKQDVISDLSTIRSGAVLGSTAVQPSTLSTELSTKQDVISDLATIRSGAEAGATAVQPSTLSTELANKQDTLVSGTNIKTINGNSILGSGDITIQGGGGSSDIDNKTIITNESGKLETAVGGWKEVIVHPASEGVNTGSLTYNQDSGDFDKYDTTIATNIYNLMTGSNAPDFATITCSSDGGNNFTIKLTGLKTAQYNDDQWNSDTMLFQGVDQNGNSNWYVQVYVVKSSGSIHVWFAEQPESINSIDNIKFGGEPGYTETIYHKIDANYLPDKENVFDITDMSDGTITDEQIEKFKKSAILKDGENYAYKSFQNEQTIIYIKEQSGHTQINSNSIELSEDSIIVAIEGKYLTKSGGTIYSYRINIDSSRLMGIQENDQYKLSTVLDGGYDDSAFSLSASDFTLDNDHYVCNNSKFLEATKNYLAYIAKVSGNGYSLAYFNFDGGNTNFSIYLDYTEELEASSGRNIRTGTVNSSELLNSVVKIYTDTNEVKSCNVIYTQAFIDFLTSNNINGFKPEDPVATGLIKKISPKFIPEEGYTNLAVSNQIKIGNTTLNETQLQALLNLLNK